jgi:endonuclease
MSKHETPKTRWYWQQVGGTLIEEFVAVEGTSTCGRRVLDGVMITDGEFRIARQAEISLGRRANSYARLMPEPVGTRRTATVPIYKKPVRLLMGDMITELGVEKGQMLAKERVLSWFRQRYPKIKEGAISAHLIRLSTDAPSRVHYNAKPVEDDLFFQLDGSHFRLYDPAADPPPVLAVAPPSGSTAPVEALEPEGTTEFAYGRDLRDFLVKNLSLLEAGLHLYEDEGITGIEFPAGGRFIDILAVDAQGRYVVLEFKVSRGYDRVVGQLLRYMAWVKQHQTEET